MTDKGKLCRDPPIMLKILPIMLCCTAQNFTHYAQIMLNIFTLQFPCFANKLALSWVNNKYQNIKKRSMYPNRTVSSLIFYFSYWLSY